MSFVSLHLISDTSRLVIPRAESCRHSSIHPCTWQSSNI
ncbi:hypothetical protein I305_05516 [Cryptococcus gattii E566]|nr:hypothetical protein I305_05516 [Cryptococcus gattii E566]